MGLGFGIGWWFGLPWGLFGKAFVVFCVNLMVICAFEVLVCFLMVGLM